MFGGPTTPAWVHNLRAASIARIRFQQREIVVETVELSGEARSAAWASLLKVWPNYALYETRTARLIPVFRLTPAGRIS